MKDESVVYWSAVSLFSVLILSFVWNYLFNFENTLVVFTKMGYPEHLIHPLVIAQILGLVLIIANKGKWLIEWAFAGFFFNLIFAIIAHYVTAEGNGAAPVIGLVILMYVCMLNRQRKYDRNDKNNDIDGTILS